MSAWDILNSPIGILFVGSVIGFAFVHLVWEPVQDRRADREKRQTIQQEVKYRLFCYDREFEDLRRGVKTTGIGWSSLDPTYNKWSLAGLVYAGWGDDVMTDCSSLIENLENGSDLALRMQSRDELRKRLFGK